VSNFEGVIHMRTIRLNGRLTPYRQRILKWEGSKGQKFSLCYAAFWYFFKNAVLRKLCLNECLPVFLSSISRIYVAQQSVLIEV
jgi:hypothetical protein